jgi:acyl-CoA synthetase (AMP-forming)/AMP-acid ligase II/thioesterase domain-containing protein/acyl carrier protein
MRSTPFEQEEMSSSIPGRFARIAAAYPQKVAVKSPGYSISYQVLDRIANRLAREIFTRIKNRPEAVALLFNNDAQLINALMGVLYSGNFYCALNPLDPPGRSADILGDLHARLLLTNTRNMEQALEIVPADCQVLNMDELSFEGGSEPIAIDYSAGDLAGIFYTSGSTGISKGVPRTHEAILHRTWVDFNDIAIDANDKLMLLRSCAFSGSLADIFDALLTGAGLYVYDPGDQSPSSLTETLKREEITIFRPPIELLRYLLNAWQKDTFFPRVRYLILSGDVLYKKDVEAVRPFFPKELVIYHHLSSSEAGLLTRLFIDRDTTIDQDIVPVGYPVAGKEVMIMGDEGSLLKPGEIGEIVVRTHFRFASYWGKPELPDEKVIADPENPDLKLYRTGDLGRVDSQGRLEFLGRKDFQVKIRGYRVNLSVVENLITAVQGVQRAIVVLRQDASGKKRMVAYLVMNPGIAVTAKWLRTDLATRLPSYMIPSVIVFMDEFPLTLNGKIDRHSLPEPEWNHPARGVKYKPPQNDVERRLVEIWQKALNIKKVGVWDDFFTLGGDSLSAAEILSDVENLFNKNIPPAIFIEYRTVEQLAAYLLKKNADTAPQSLVPVQPHGTKPALFLLPGHQGDAFYFRLLASHLGNDQPVFAVEMLSTGPKSISSTDLEETARRCLEEIREFQPSGPYHLAGHSFGGVLAFEIAQQLVAAGQKVAFLGLLDSRAPGNRPHASLLDRVTIHLENLRGLTGKERLDYFRKRFKNILIELTEVRFFRALLFTLKLVPKDVSSVNRIASRGYKPGFYPGKITVFRVRTRQWYVKWDPTEDWQKYAARVEIHDVPGDHATLVEEPYVRTLAYEVKRCLEPSADAEPQEQDPSPKMDNP